MTGKRSAIAFIIATVVVGALAAVLPWLGVMCFGLAAGQWLLARHRGALAGALAAPFAPLATLGRWSLAFYMVHQPVLIGAILAWRAIAA